MFILLFPAYLMAEEDLSLRYEGKAPTSLVGDGKYVVKTTPERFLAVKGLELDGSLRFFRGREEMLPASTLWNATFFPGGVVYDIRVGRDSLHVMYGVLPDAGFTLAVKASAATQTGLTLNKSIPLYSMEKQVSGTRYVYYTQNKTDQLPANNLEDLRSKLEKPYREQLVLISPNKTLDKSVAFSQFLLDLGFNGEIMLCELFRWLDIWARDLGSGLQPGALATGRADMARKSLVYDLGRYALMSPEYCKNSNDPSQGGTAAEIGWTARSAWNYYMFSGDKEALRKDADIIRPWVKHWISRDYNEDGLIIDVTEFMDHMLMMVTTNGVSTLATNAMYSAMLNYFAKIELELGNKKEAQKLLTLHNKTVDAINTVYWNKEKEYFNNMLLWDVASERSSQTFQSILLKMGSTDDVRARKTLDYLKKNNWCDYGSITIVPRMNHVPLTNDQNVKVWPWWNMWEIEARFRHNDKEGAYKLLDLAARTIEDEKYPGLLEETLDTDGTSIGGNVFMTGAGNLLEVVVKDLLGVESLSPGWTRIKVTPSVPAEWTNYECRIPTPGGFLTLNCRDRKLTVTVEDPKIKTVEVDNSHAVTVIGAAKGVYQPTTIPERKYNTVQKTAVPPMQEGKTALFYDPEFHTAKPNLDLDAIDVKAMGNLTAIPYKKIVIAGNSLPLFTKEGKSIKKSLEDYTAKGGTVIFYGATVNAKTEEDGAGILGEQCGIIDWYQYLPARKKTALSAWEFIPDPHNTSPDQPNGLYHTTFTLDKSAAGKEIYVELGPLVGLDSLFINNTYIANYRDMEPYIRQEYPTETGYPDTHRYKTLSRMYIVKPGTEAYKAFRFDGTNQVTVKLFNDRMGYGFPERNKPNIGYLTETKSWQATDDAIEGLGFVNPKRKGVNYWGSEQFFNSWSTKNGLFGFEVEGSGVQFCENTALEGMENLSIPVTATYTDFPLFKPWNFEILAYTTTRQNLLYPMTTERYPCIVRIVNAKTKGGYVLINPSVANHAAGKTVLRNLKVNL